ncbi:MAG: hypothetical protein ACRDGH_04610 [Candidatus Limnocylindria bacterium]
MRPLCAGMVTVALLGPVLALLVAGCAGRRIEQGVFYSTKGYRVRIPGPEWMVVDESRADLELKARDGRAGMLANAICEAHVARRPVDVLQRQLLLGLRNQRVVERSEVIVAGRAGTRAVLEARAADNGEHVRIGTVTVTDTRCVYDLIFVAPVSAFAERQADFAAFVASFTAGR